MLKRYASLVAILLSMGAACPVAAAAVPDRAYVYCTAPSTSARGEGLIVTAIFRSRSDQEFIQTAFTNYLRSSYAPYGNGWEFPERSPACRTFKKQRDAEIQRSLEISRIPQPVQSIYNVTFQID